MSESLLNIMKTIKCDSSAIRELHVYPLEGKAQVMYNNGDLYEYSNVSRRAIFSVIANDKQSLGKWVNHNCKTKGVGCEWVGNEWDEGETVGEYIYWKNASDPNKRPGSLLA